MKPASVVLLMLLLSVYCVRLAAQENPFARMAGMNYADYSLELGDMYGRISALDTVEAQKLVDQVKDIARGTGRKNWELEAMYFEQLLLHRKLSLDKGHLYAAGRLLGQVFDLLKKAESGHVPALELKLRYSIIEYYWLYGKNYEAAFNQCAIQEERLKGVSTEEIPEKALYYIQIGNAHYEFNDYTRAIPYYQKALEEKETPSNQQNKQSARNGLGLCYRYGTADYDRSDSCFLSITRVAYLRPEDERLRNNWDGIAEGNLGRNLFLRGAYDNAIPLLKGSIEKVLPYNDYGFAAGPAATLAEIYLKEGNLPEVERYMDLASDYYRKVPREGRLQQIYEVKAKYYAMAGNPSLSTAYMDSTLLAKKAYDDQFNAMLLLHMEQKESARRELELVQEKEKREEAQLRVLILSAGLILIGSLLALIAILYRRKRAAYRELVRKSQEWAQVKTVLPAIEPSVAPGSEELSEIANSAPDEADYSIMRQIVPLIEDAQIYKDAMLSVDLLAHQLGLKRHYVSNAINRCTGKSFNTFVNEYRVKEAIRLLSEHSADAFSIDGIAFDTGFNDRRNFYRVFKKMTGLSPTEFRKNAVKN